MNAFLWVGNHPGIDLTNTVVADPHGLVDLLGGWDDAVEWAHDASVGGPRGARSPEVGDVPGGPDDLATVRALREGLRTFLDHGDHGMLDAVLAEVPVRLRTADGPPLIGPVIGSDPAQAMIAAIAVVVADATTLPPDRVRRCANRECVLHFNDTTRGGRRRWCSMATCGNRAKQTALRARGTGPD